MRLLLALFAPFFMLLCGSPAFAQEGPWRVSEANGTVTVTNANGSRTVREGAVLQAGDNIRTAARSSVVLVRGREFVTLRQSSSIKIPAARRERSVLQIIQEYGSALFNIGRQPDPHFGVDTPYMAAVVKGTVFTITVSEQEAVLQVTEGAVETSTLDGGARDLITPGVIAMVSANDQLRLVVEGDTREIIDSPARAPDTSSSSSTPTRNEQSSRTTPPSQSANVQRIETAITSAPGDLAGLSNGFVTRASTPAVSQATASRGAPQIAAVGQGRGRNLGGFSDASVCLVGNCDAVQPNGNGNGNSGGNGNGNSGGNGNGNSGGNGNGNSGGNGNGNSGGNGNGNSGGNGNGNSGGNGNGNSGGNGNGNSGGNGNGNSGGNGNGNSGGNGNGNSGGNGNGNSGGNGNGNSGGNGNGNSGGNGNGNSGGNGNGNSGGNGNGNSGGNGNGNSGGNGNGNSGGNGNGNSGGNGNGNSGGNGNGNSGGNGNGNSGGNGNGNGNGNGVRR